MWTVVYMAQSNANTLRVQQLLEKNNIISRIHFLKSEDETTSDCCELLVPEAEVQQALSLIIDNNF